MALAFAAFPGIVQAEQNPACAKYQEPLEYNACLASHGPKANIGAAHGGGGDAPAHASASGIAAPNAHRSQPRETRRPHRVHMEFEVR